MRFWTATTAAALVATFAALVTAQQNAINIPAGQSTLDITAGQEQTITWSNPSSGTVTIKLQQDPVTPAGGIVLASNVPASAGTASFLIQADQVNSFQYTIEIIDDSNPNNYNFSPNFGVKGATGTATGSTATTSVTGSGSSSMTATDSSSATTDSNSSSTITNTSSASSSPGSNPTGSSSTKSSSSSQSTSQTTSAPSSNGGAITAVKVSGALLAVVAAGVVVVL